MRYIRCEYRDRRRQGCRTAGGSGTVGADLLYRTARRPLLSGPSRFSNGFDLKNEDAPTTIYINAYTDISQTRLKVRTRTNVLEDDPGTTGTGMDERYTDVDIEDADYLVAGIWMTVDNAALGDSQIQRLRVWEPTHHQRRFKLLRRY